MRAEISNMDKDRVLYKDLDKAATLVDSGKVVGAVEAAVGPLD